MPIWILEHRENDCLPNNVGEIVAMITKGDYLPLIESIAYAAKVACLGSPHTQTQWRSAPILFDNLKATQQWCELEIRLREVGELA